MLSNKEGALTKPKDALWNPLKDIRLRDGKRRDSGLKICFVDSGEVLERVGRIRSTDLGKPARRKGGHGRGRRAVVET